MPSYASLLRSLVLAQGGCSAASACAALFDPDLAARLFGFAGEDMSQAGVVLASIALALLVLGSRARPPRAAVMVLIGCDAVWSVVSKTLLLGGAIAPTDSGRTLFIVQGILVGLFGEALYFCLRRSRRLTAPASAPPSCS